MGSERITDISAFDRPDGALPSGKGARLARYLGEIVSAASILPVGETQLSPLRCRRRPKRQACGGRIELGRDGPNDAIRWHCSRCGDRGAITNWRHTRWDLGPALSSGRVVSLSHARAQRALRHGAIEQATLYEIVAELIDGPVPLDQLVMRKLRVSGDRSLHELHRLLAEAYDRSTDDAYEFLFGAPYEFDARRFSGVGEMLCDDEPLCETHRARLGELGLESGLVFGYLCDFDAEWVHRLTVVSVGVGARSAEIVQRVGRSPALDEEDWSDELWTEVDEEHPLTELYGPYLPDEPPDASKWLGMEDLERLLLILEGHTGSSSTRNHPTGDSSLLHGVVHEVAETALAEGRADAHDYLQYCRDRGMTRHEALHQLGGKLITQGLAGFGGGRSRRRRRR